MNKKRVAGLVLLLPLGLLAACGGGGPTSLSISKNWYANTMTSQIPDTTEELEYAVTFKQPSVQGDCFVTYEEGTYKTTFEKVNYTFAHGQGNVYHYKTQLNITGHYTYKGTEGEAFSDSVVSDVWFRTEAELLPIKSHKEIRSTSPLPNPGAELFYEKVNIGFDIIYNTADSSDGKSLDSAEITSTLLDTGETSDPRTVNIGHSGSFFDNEQILFALRGLDMSAVSNFYTIDPRTNDVNGVTFSTTPEKTTFTPKSLTIGQTAATEDIQAYTVRFHYNISNAGPERTAIYAAKTSANNNTYRNVLLQLEDPIPNGYGTLIYTLKNAKFA